MCFSPVYRDISFFTVDVMSAFIFVRCLTFEPALTSFTNSTASGWGTTQQLLYLWLWPFQAKQQECCIHFTGQRAALPGDVMLRYRKSWSSSDFPFHLTPWCLSPLCKHTFPIQWMKRAVCFHALWNCLNLDLMRQQTCRCANNKGKKKEECKPQ